jgi:hypothetical protein
MHQVVRTTTGRVYIFAQELYHNFVHAYRATTTGTPAGFAEADAIHRPVGQGDISVVDAAIDGADRIHLIWMDNSGPLVYGTFDTSTDTWGASTQLANSAWPSSSSLRQGSEGVALALDSAGTAHIVYTIVEGGLRHLYYNNNSGGSWTHQSRLDDQSSYNNAHPTLAFDANGRLYAAWLVERGPNQGDIRVRSRSGAGSWDAASQLVDSNQFADNYYSLDQGPSLLVTRDGRLHIAYIGAYEPVAGAPGGYAYGRIHHKYSSDGVTWIANDPPTVHYTHDPSLATDSAGNLYLFGHREDWLNADCAPMYMYKQPAGGNWSSDWSLLANGCFDSSVSVKWAWNFWNSPSILDIVFWTQQQPNQLYYMTLPGN